MTLGERVKKYREKLGLSQDELATKLGYKSRATIYKIEKGINDIPFDKIGIFASALGVSEQLLLHDEEELKDRIEPSILELFDGNVENAVSAANQMGIPVEMLGRQIDSEIFMAAQGGNSSQTFKRIPIKGEVAAGTPLYGDDEFDGYIDGPKDADFAFRVFGDSMEPTFVCGDIIFVRAMPEVSNGSIAVVVIEHSATLKHVYLAGPVMTLISDNKKYNPIVINVMEREDVRIIGLVIGFTRMLSA